MKRKICRYCNDEKPLSDFTPKKDCVDGYEHKCIECTKMQKHERYIRNKKTILEKAAKYRAKNQWRYTKSIRRWRQGNKDKYRAQTVLNHAIERHGMKKPSSCSFCGITDKPIHGHHTDYSKPLDVVWVCPQCHKDIHREMEDRE